jgi:hypothetical protein
MERYMPVLNHHIVAPHERSDGAQLLRDSRLGPRCDVGEFAVLRVVGDTTLDFIDTEGDFDRQHYAFLVTEAEFDEIIGRIKERRIRYWSDLMHNDPGHINTWDDRRGVYFDDPNGYRLEIINRPYGSGGTEAKHPHPLISPTIGASKGPTNIH